MKKRRRTTEQLKEELLTSNEGRSGFLQPVPAGDLLSTGSTLLNLACSGRPQGGFAKGKYHFIVGDSIAGKTWLSLSCLAEAARSRRFDDYRFIHDNAEGGAMMDIGRFFGRDVSSRLEPPGVDDGGPVCSSTVENFYYHLDDAFEDGRPFIYILDSMDVLTSLDDISKFDEHKKASRSGRESTGSYGVSKAKLNSERLRVVIGKLRDSGSILIIINQTRDNIGFGFEKKTRSGGRALRFYASVEIWLSVRSKLQKNVKGKKHQQGIMCQAEIKKNRLTGQLHTVRFPIYHDYGMDDLGSCIDFLVENGLWRKTGGGVITGSSMKLKGRRDSLISEIEGNGREKELRVATALGWKKIQDSLRIKRKKRY